MSHCWLAIAAVAGFCSVLAGAAGAHFAGDPRAVELLRTGALYGMVHATALVALVALSRDTGPRCGTMVAGWGFAVGIVLFSFSLFGMALTGARWLGVVTPFGGVAFMVGWAGLAVSALRPR